MSRQILRLLLAVILFSSFKVNVASAWGGQEGNGGNVCNAGVYGWRAVEETEYPELSREESRWPPGLRFFKLRGVDGKSWVTDLRNVPAGISARKKIEMLADYDSELSNSLLAMFENFKRVHLTYSRLEQAYRVDTSNNSYCRDNRVEAAIVSTWDGITVLSGILWHKLNNQSKMVLLIHETLRYAQMYTKWFDVNDKELQYLTMLLVANKHESFFNYDWYRKFKENRSDTLDNAAPLISFNWNRDLVSGFIHSDKEQIKNQLEALVSAGVVSSEGEALNMVRSVNSAYIRFADEKVGDYFY